MTIQAAWETIKKAQTPDSNGALDTIDWVYREASKVIESVVKEVNQKQ